MAQLILVHGGAGKAATPSALKECERAVINGRKAASMSAIAAVEAAICTLEDAPAFDAGLGAYPNLLGEIELDAGIMDSELGQSGTVAAVQRIKNPIKLARILLEETSYRMVAGAGAELMARTLGLETQDLMTPERREQWSKGIKGLASGTEEGFNEIPRIQRNPTVEQWAREGKLRHILSEVGDTVGAVAIDEDGRLAAGSSTGGSLLKWPGRVGSAAMPGAGFYAKRRAGAAAATGHGETLMSEMVCRQVVELMAGGLRAQEAVNNVLEKINNQLGGAKRVGIIAVDHEGGCGAGVNIEGGLPSALGLGQNQDVRKPFRTVILPTPPLTEGAAT